jgi:methionine synthase I (cobalamin-dependent)
MGKIMGVVVGIIGIAIVLTMFPIITDSVSTVQTDQNVESYAAVATGIGETSADVVLSEDLYNGRSASVVSITSDNIGDTPVAGTYTALTNTLAVNGLKANDTRTLVVTYKIDALGDYTGLGAMAGLTPLLIWVAIIAVLIGSIAAVFKGRGG